MLLSPSTCACSAAPKFEFNEAQLMCIDFQSAALQESLPRVPSRPPRQHILTTPSCFAHCTCSPGSFLLAHTRLSARAADTAFELGLTSFLWTHAVCSAASHHQCARTRFSNHACIATMCLFLQTCSSKRHTSPLTICPRQVCDIHCIF